MLMTSLLIEIFYINEEMKGIERFWWELYAFTLICVPFIAGMPKHAASIHIHTAIKIVILVARFPLCEWNFRSGSTIAKKRSPLSAVNVNTDTPILKSLKYSDVTHNGNPHGQEFST